MSFHRSSPGLGVRSLFLNLRVCGRCENCSGRAATTLHTCSLRFYCALDPKNKDLTPLLQAPPEGDLSQEARNPEVRESNVYCGMSHHTSPFIAGQRLYGKRVTSRVMCFALCAESAQLMLGA